jgi:hypothetical protein
MPRVGATFVIRLTRRGLGGKVTFNPLFLECSGVFVICRVSIGPKSQTSTPLRARTTQEITGDS